MRIGNGTFAVRVAPPAFEPSRAAPAAEPVPTDRAVMREQLERMDRELDELRATLRGVRASQSRSAPIVRGSPLDLTGGATAATLSSTGELNTEATLLTTRTPQWSAPGGPVVAIGGVYSGPDDDTWTFTVDNKNGRKIDVTDRTGQSIAGFTLNTTGVAQTFTLPDELQATFTGLSTLSRGDRFTLTMSRTTDGAIDPAKPFNGTGTSSSRLPLGTAITTGSFTVNGTSVSVAASDSLDTVLARITARVPTVLASYDATTERVTMRTSQPGADQAITLGGDTSGLLAAMRLPTSAKGLGTYAQQPMAAAPQLAAVRAGTLTIGGQQVAINPATQTVDDVVSAIDRLDGITARRGADGRVQVIGTPGVDLDLADGGTGLLGVLGLAPGLHVARRGGSTTLSALASRRIAAEVGDLRSVLDGLVANTGLVGLAAEVRTQVGVAVEVSLRDTKGVTRFGALSGLDRLAAAQDPTSRARSTLEVQRSYRSVRALLLGQRPGEGLIDRLDEVVRTALAKVDDPEARI